MYKRLLSLRRRLFFQGSYHLRGKHRLRQIIPDRIAKRLRHSRAQNKNFSLYAAQTELNALLGQGHSKVVRPHRGKRHGRFKHAMPIGIGLNHGHHAHIGRHFLFENLVIMPNRIHIDLYIILSKHISTFPMARARGTHFSAEKRRLALLAYFCLYGAKNMPA